MNVRDLGRVMSLLVGWNITTISLSLSAAPVLKPTKIHVKFATNQTKENKSQHRETNTKQHNIDGFKSSTSIRTIHMSDVLPLELIIYW